MGAENGDRWRISGGSAWFYAGSAKSDALNSDLRRYGCRPCFVFCPF